MVGQRSAATPKFATTTRAPTWRARTFTAAPPRAKFSTIWAVTAWRVRAHALGRDAVVGGQGEDHRGLDPRHGIPGDHDHADRELLQPPEAPSRASSGVSRRWRAAAARRPSGATMEATRRSRAITRAPPPPGDAGAPEDFTTSGQPATMQDHLVGGTRHGLVDEPEGVAKAAAERRLGVDSPADLVRDEDEGEGGHRGAPRARSAAGARGRQSEQLRSFVEQVCHPQVETVHDHDVGLRRRARSRADASARGTSMVRQPGRALRAVAGDPRRHLLVPGLGGGDEGDPSAVRARASDGERALPRADAPQDEDASGGLTGELERGLRLGGIACGSPGLPRRPVRSARVPGRSPDSRIVLLPAPFPAPSRQWALSAGFVPDHSDGVVAVSHRLPSWPPRGAPGTP